MGIAKKLTGDEESVLELVEGFFMLPVVKQILSIPISTHTP